MLALLLAPLASAAFDDDAGTGRDAVGVKLRPGSYQGGLAASAGDTSDWYTLGATPGWGLGYELRVPPTEATRTFVYVAESWDFDLNTKYIYADTAGVFRWSGGSEHGEPTVSLANFYGDFNYTMTVTDTPMPDLAPTGILVGPADARGARVVRVDIQNRGSSDAPATETILTARHDTDAPPPPTPPTAADQPRIDSTRHIQTLPTPQLAPGESVTLEATWHTMGEVGEVDVEARVTLLDARWDNNDARTHVKLGDAPVSADPLNTRASDRIGGIWAVAGTESSNAHPGLMAGIYLWNGISPGPRVASANLLITGPYAPNATMCVIDSCTQTGP